MRKLISVMFCGLLALPVSAGPLQSYEILLKNHRYAEAEKGLVALLARVKPGLEQARVYRLLVEAAAGLKARERERGYLEREALVFEQAGSPEDAFAARLQSIQLLPRAEAIEAMKKLEAQPRPTRKLTLLNFYLLRAQYVTDIRQKEQNWTEALASASTPSERVTVYLAMTYGYLDGQPDKAKESLKKAYEAVRFSDDSQVSQALAFTDYRLASREHNYDHAETTVKAMLTSARQQHRQGAEADAWDLLGNLMDDQKRYPEMVECARRAFHLRQASGNIAGMISELNFLTSRHRLSPGDLSPEAWDWVAAQSRLLIQDPRTGTGERALLELTLGRLELARRPSQRGAVEALFRHALSDYAKLHDSSGQQTCRMELAWILEKQARDAEALQLYRESMEPGAEFHSNTAMGVVRALLRLGRYPEVIALLHQSLDAQKTADLRLEVLDALLWASHDQLDLGEYYRDLALLVKELPSGSAAVQKEMSSRLVYRLSAFSVAGASSVISSLWPVDDEATACLFAEFYKQLHLGLPRVEALRLAGQACRAKFPQPFYWAAFTLLGSSR